MLDRFIDGEPDRESALFRGPYVSVKLPFRTGTAGPDYFADFPMDFPPYGHQQAAFERIGGDQTNNTLLDEGESPEVDADQIRAEAEEITGHVWGPFGRPAPRGDHAVEADFKELARRGRDYDVAGYRKTARTVYSIVAEALESNRHLFNPHRKWHHSLRETLLVRLYELEKREE